MKRLAGYSAAVIGGGVLLVTILMIVVSPQGAVVASVFFGLPSIALILFGNRLIRRARWDDYSRAYDQQHAYQPPIAQPPAPYQGEVTPVRGVPVAVPPPPQQYQPAPQVVNVPVDSRGRPYKPKKNTSPAVTAFATLLVLAAAAAWIWPNIERAMKNDAANREIASQMEDSITRRLAEDLPGRVTDINLSANRGTINLTVLVEDRLVDVFFAMGIKSFVEMETGQRLDLIDVRLVGPTLEQRWRWSSFNPDKWVPQ